MAHYTGSGIPAVLDMMEDEFNLFLSDAMGLYEQEKKIDHQPRVVYIGGFLKDKWQE
ncbi:MAG: hypothetical protein LUD76_10190 [Alistipes sp.]|nr:hypothetical protein [Alistipes sp.]